MAEGKAAACDLLVRTDQADGHGRIQAFDLCFSLVTGAKDMMAGGDLTDQKLFLTAHSAGSLVRHLTQLIEMLLSMSDAECIEAYCIHGTEERNQGSGHVEMGDVGPGIKKRAAGATAFSQAGPHPWKVRQLLPGGLDAQPLFHLYATGEHRRSGSGLFERRRQMSDDLAHGPSLLMLLGRGRVTRHEEDGIVAHGGEDRLQRLKEVVGHLIQVRRPHVAHQVSVRDPGRIYGFQVKVHCPGPFCLGEIYTGGVRSTNCGSSIRKRHVPSG